MPALYFTDELDVATVGLSADVSPAAAYVRLQGGKCLSPAYLLTPASYWRVYAQVEAAEQRWAKGLVEDRVMRAAWERFNTIHDWAVEHFGEDVLQASRPRAGLRQGPLPRPVGDLKSGRSPWEE
jgi:hypothetical protein